MPTGILVAVGSVDFESAVLTAASMGSLHVVRRCVDVADLLATAATRQAEIALVSTALGGLDTEVLARLREESVASVGLVRHEESADAGLLRALGVDALLGVDRLAALPGLVSATLDSSLALPATHAALVSADSGSKGDDGSGRISAGRVIALWGPTGAPGRSVVTLGLASLFSRADVTTMVVDADVYGGAQAQMLGMLDESSGLLAAARAANRGRLDCDELAAHARAVSPRMRVLTGLPRSDRWIELSPVLLRRILDTARSVCAITLVDCGFCIELDEEVSYDIAAPRRNGATLAALQQADLVVVVGSADPVGLGRLLRALADLRVQAPEVAPRVVVNRMRPTLGWTNDDVAAIVRRTSHLEVEAFLPDDPTACDRAVVHGQSLVECAPGSKLVKALDCLASSLAPELGLSLPTAGSLERRRRAPARH